MENQNARLAVSFIIGLVVGIGGYALWDNRLPADPMTGTELEATEEMASTTPLVMVEGDNGLVVTNQAPGTTVEVAEVVVQKPSWIAIRDNVNGVPGKILGAVLVDSGKTSAKKVQLLRATVKGQSYLAVIHNDDGNYKNFSSKVDTILNDAAGKPVMTAFTVGDEMSNDGMMHEEASSVPVL